jgi:predicted Zn-dependent protease
MVGMGAYALAYDRDMEYEADHIGMMLMAKAGYDPSAAIRFWTNSDEIFGGSNSLSFFSTHPSNSDRLDALNEYLPIAQQYYTQRQPMAQAQVAVNQKSKRKKKDS